MAITWKTVRHSTRSYTCHGCGDEIESGASYATFEHKGVWIKAHHGCKALLSQNGVRCAYCQQWIRESEARVQRRHLGSVAPVHALCAQARETAVDHFELVG